MALIIADRVKETTATQGTGSITLSGATFGGFQSFSDAVGEGNTTYYCIQNESNFEIGIGTYSSNTLSRDTVFQSSNSDSKISISGAAIVFCVVPADRLVFKDETNSVVFPTPFAFKRSDDGDYWQALSTDHTNRVASFFLEEGSDPTWKIGLKTTTSQTVAPYYAYISAKDGFIELRGNSSSILSVGDEDAQGLQVNHQLKNIIDIRKNGGEIAIQNLDLNSDETTKVKNNSVAYTVFEVESSVSHVADLQTWSVSVDQKASINQHGDFETVANVIAPSGKFTAVRFSDNSVQLTAGLPLGSGSLINTNIQNIVSNSGYFQSYVSQSSGVLQSQIDQNTSNISATSGYFESRLDSTDSTLSSTSGYFESRVDSADSSNTATSGYFESRVDSSDVAINTVSGLLTPSGQSLNFAGNVLTYNNSDGGSFTADLSSLSTFDTSGVSLGYSAGTLTYTNNAGGTFDVDLSSISGDVYSMIVGGAPATLDTLNEIAAALNDDANLATTLTTLISTSSGNLQSQITSNDGDITQLNSDIATVSGIASKTFTITASSSTNYTFDGMGLNSAADPTVYLHKGHTYYFDKQTSSHPFRISASDGGSVYQDADSNNVEINGQGILTFEVPQNAPDKLYYYCTAHPSSMKGIIYTTTDGSTSGYFESRADQADSDIATVSGLLYNDASLSGYFESRVDQADSDILAVSGLIGDADFLPGSSGGLIDQNAEDIVTVSGLLDSVNPTGTPSGISFFDDSGSLSGNSSFVFDGQNATIDGYINASGQRVITSPNIHHITQVTQSEYDAITPESATFYIITDAPSVSGYFESRVDQSDSDIATVSGLLDSVNPTGTPSGISFFDDSGSLSGNNSLIYDGQDIKVSGRMFASGEQVITSDEIFHIKQLTQIEYNSITPNSATFYIITDSETEGPVVQPIKTVSSDYTILTSDYTVYTTAALTLTLPSAVGNQGVMFNIKNISTGLVTINGVGGNTIDGQSSVGISTQYQSISLQSTNSDWIIV